MNEAPVATERRPGRPRSLQADEAILEAATEAFIECGWDGLTIEGVAARAGVGKTTIYRRYPGRIELLVAAAARLAQEKGAVPDTGSLRGDLLALVHAYVGMLSATRTGRAVPAMIVAAARNPDVAIAHRDLLGERRREAAEPIDRAIRRGELPIDVDLGLMLDLLFAPVFYRVFVSLEPVGAAYIDGLVDAVIRAVAT